MRRRKSATTATSCHAVKTKSFHLTENSRVRLTINGLRLSSTVINTTRRLLGSRISLGQEDRQAQKAKTKNKDLARSQFATVRNNSSGGSLSRLGRRGRLRKPNEKRQKRWRNC